jgi:hypothetical protein
MIRHDRASPKQIADQIADYMKVSASTVRRILKKNGYFRARCRCKPILSAKNVKDRLAWADANENQDWTRVIFTDESAFELGDDHAHESCWRLPHEEYNEKCLSPKKRGARSSMSGEPSYLAISSPSCVSLLDQRIKKVAKKLPLKR